MERSSDTELEMKGMKGGVVTGPVEVLHGALGAGGGCVRRVRCVRCRRCVYAVRSAGLDGGTRGGTSRRAGLQPLPGLPLKHRAAQGSDRWRAVVLHS